MGNAGFLGVTKPTLRAEGPFAYGLVARGEVCARTHPERIPTLGRSSRVCGVARCHCLLPSAQAHVYFDTPDADADFDSHLWAHAAGALLVTEAGGRVTDTVGNPLDFSLCRDGRTLPQHVVGTIATNRDLHPDVVRQLGLTVAEKAAQ